LACYRAKISDLIILCGRPFVVAGFCAVLFTILLSRTVSAAAGPTGIPDLAATAYDRPWQVTSYAEQAGLTHQRVFDIAFEKDGNVWLAADNGLWRYNGYAWQLFDTNSGLPSSFVRAVLVTRNGELWVGTDKGAGVFDPDRNRYETRGSEKGLAGPNIRQISEDPDGTLWFCCDQWPETATGKGGLTSRRQGRWETYDSKRGMPLDYIIGYFRDSSGRQFAMTPHGWVQRRGNDWARPQNGGYEAEECVLHMAEGAGGALFAQGEHALLILTNNQWQVQDSGTVLVGNTQSGEIIAARWNNTRGTLRFDSWDGQKFVPLSGPVACPPGSRFYRLRQSPDGAIWCVGNGTVVQWAYRSGQWTFYPDLPPPSLLDKQGRLWFSGESNVVVLQDGVLRRSSQLRQFFALDKDGAALGLAADGNGLVIVPPTRPDQYQRAECGIETPVRALSDADGRLWVVGYNRDNSTVFARRDGQSWVKLSAPELQNKRIGPVSVDPQRGIWAIMFPTRSVGYDLVHVLDDRLEWQPSASGRPPQTYPNFFIGAGQCWMPGYAGLYQRAIEPSSVWRKVDAFQETGASQWVVGKNEVLFLVPGGRSGKPGCALYHDGKWEFQNGNFYRAAVSQDKTTFFLGGRGGMYIRRVSGTLDMRYLPLPEDLLVGSIVQDQDGTLWIGTSDGVFHYCPAHSAPGTRITASLTEVRQNERLPVSFCGVRRFSASNLPEAFRYSWRIDGGVWSAFEAPPQWLSLPSLGPGQHQLEARASDLDDNVDPTPALLDFTVLDIPLQQQPWFMPVVGLLVVLIAFLSWVGITRTRQISVSNTALRQEIAVRCRAETELKKTQDELEQRVVERTAELLHANQSLSREIAERKQAEETQHQLEEQLRQSQKMEAIGTLAGGIAHDFNNILTVIISYTELVLRRVSGQPDVLEKLDRVLTAAERARNLVQQILTFSRRQKEQRRVVDLDLVINETMKLLRPALPATIQIEIDIKPKISPIFADPTQIHQVLMNLCANAEQAMRGRPGRLEIKLDEVVVDDALARLNPDLRRGKYVKLSVRDNGCGMSEQIQQRIFDPFFTTKGPGEGTGLGLAVVHGIVKSHDGAIVFRSQPDAGAEFDIYLPAHLDGTIQAGSVPRAGTPPKGNGEHILLVDDEPAVCNAFKAVLTHAGYRVTTRNDPLVALDEFLEHHDQYDLVFTDLTMPGMTGIELAKRIFEIRPGLPILLATGFGGSWEPKLVENLGIRAIIQKPADLNSIGRIVSEALSSNAKK
jgi:signal transduction histidine kinase/CheY-like chemotaxis protein/streptogramin lyase